MRTIVPEYLRAAVPDNGFHAWLENLASLDVSGLDICLPEGEELADELRWLDVPEHAIAEVLASRPDPTLHPDAWWLLERCVARLINHLGLIADMAPFPELPEELARQVPHLYLHVFVAMLPHTRAYHRERDIPGRLSQAILADLGRNVRVHERRYGEVGLGVVNWITLHFRGLIYDLGRLQFERAQMRGTLANAMRERAVDARPDETVLSIHVPDSKGPLTPEACDASIACAHQFFAEHFPEERYRFAVCHSWLLDPQLNRCLRPDSNIVRFQERFELADRLTEADRSIVQFVFGPVPDDPADLPQRTSLERAVREHLLAGEHWYVRNGWFRFD
ncbi:MAG TPA: acyltransferase domain-containing protein [Thermomicrobiales bacterium]|nr:acyltransferase domain-containing protein [Thermomicrobiales bacterium]